MYRRTVDYSTTSNFLTLRGLVKRSGRSEGGFRLFGQRQIQDLKFIRKS